MPEERALARVRRGERGAALEGELFEVELRAGLKATGRSTLKEVKPLTKRWSFWGATGAGVLLATAGTFAALNSGDPEHVPPGDATVPFP